MKQSRRSFPLLVSPACPEVPIDRDRIQCNIPPEDAGLASSEAPEEPRMTLGVMDSERESRLPSPRSFSSPSSCSRYVRIQPLPLTFISPRSLILKWQFLFSHASRNAEAAAELMCTVPGGAVCSMRAATLTVSPKRQKRGLSLPTTPDTRRPVWIPMRSLRPRPPSGFFIPAATLVIARPKPATSRAYSAPLAAPFWAPPRCSPPTTM
mmetsp:Transcript_30795/g.86311  ORF Transcript_30795/g.86311 Transcript_30795/m.86311 type:complete len:209 (-) Transcript_30795:1559-2185(-)